MSNDSLLPGPLRGSVRQVFHSDQRSEARDEVVGVAVAVVGRDDGGDLLVGGRRRDELGGGATRERCASQRNRFSFAYLYCFPQNQ